jgi:O-succinylbenzoate synthase
MKVERLELLHLRMPLARALETPLGQVHDHEVLLVRAESGGVSGYGEVPATAFPFRSPETVATAWHVIRDFMAARLRDQEFAGPGPVSDLFAFVQGHPMAKAGIESAVLDLFGRVLGKPLSRLLGGEREEVPCALVLEGGSGQGDLLKRAGEARARRYQRLSVRIRPREDVELLAALRREFGAFPLSADAGGAYTPADEDRLRRLDDFGLVMLEQPLASDGDHARLQSRMKTPIALGSCLNSYEEARRAMELGACRAINLHPSRVGGPYSAKMVHNQARARGLLLGCGGRLRTGVGRAHDLALASLPHFTLAPEIEESAACFPEDVIEPAMALTPEGTLEVPRAPGIGYNVSERALRRFCVRREYALC